VQGDQRLLTQLIQNLVQNVVLHSCGEFEQPEIQLTLELAGDEITLGIQDNRPGIAKGDQARIWEPFKSVSSNQSGTGRGLSICKKIVERHGGKIWCEQGEAGGAHFRFSISR
jgi:signal transduction histidine kinase